MARSPVPSGGDKLLLALSSQGESLEEAALEDRLQLQGGCCCCCCSCRPLSWPSWFLSSRITDLFWLLPFYKSASALLFGVSKLPASLRSASRTLIHITDFLSWSHSLSLVFCRPALRWQCEQSVFWFSPCYACMRMHACMGGGAAEIGRCLEFCCDSPLCSPGQWRCLSLLCPRGSDNPLNLFLPFLSHRANENFLKGWYLGGFRSASVWECNHFYY